MYIHVCRKEAFWVFLANLFRAGNSAIIDFSSALINLLMFSTYVLTTGNSLTSSMVFTTLSLVTFVRMISSNAVSEGVLGIRELNVAFRRLQVIECTMNLQLLCKHAAEYAVCSTNLDLSIDTRNQPIDLLFQYARTFF